MRRALAAALLALACTPRAPEPLPNVLLVTLDTVRTDHLSLHGYARDTAPSLARVAEQGVRFDLAYAAASSTLPSHATLFTSLPPRAHGVVKNGLPLAADLDTLPERLRARGAQTAAIVSSFVLDRRFGLDQGFDHYEDDFRAGEGSYVPPGRRWRGFDVGESFDRRANFTTDRAIAWLDGARDPARPFFLFVHYFDPHDPYDPPEPWKSRFARAPGAAPSLADALLRRDLVDAYDGEIAFTDAEVGRLLAHLAARGLERDTLVVVTADHGEGLGQHGVVGHAVNVYEEAVRVPLVLRWPGRLPAGGVVAEPVDATDVLPTLLELLGLPAAPDDAGRSLACAARGERCLDAEHAVFTHRRPYEKPAVEDGMRVHGELFAVRRGRWKWIEGDLDGTRELYDLVEDPHERANVATRESARAEALSNAIREHRAAHPARATAAEIAPDDRERLRALGYAD